MMFFMILLMIQSNEHDAQGVTEDYYFITIIRLVAVCMRSVPALLLPNLIILDHNTEAALASSDVTADPREPRERPAERPAEPEHEGDAEGEEPRSGVFNMLCRFTHMSKFSDSEHTAKQHTSRHPIIITTTTTILSGSYPCPR